VPILLSCGGANHLPLHLFLNFMFECFEIINCLDKHKSNGDLVILFFFKTRYCIFCIRFVIGNYSWYVAIKAFTI